MMLRSLWLLALAGSSLAAADSRVTPYSCDGIPTAAPRNTPSANAIASWRELATDPVVGDAWIARVELVAFEVKSPREVSDRVRLQHEMLRVAQRLHAIDGSGANGAIAVAAEHTVMKQIRAVAATAEELADLGLSSHPGVEAILGPDIVDRATSSCTTGSLKHVREARGLLAYRPLRAATTRALVAQLVAYDTNGEPHITPIVDEIELRLGDEVSSPACIVRAGNDGVLRPIAQAALEEHAPFVRLAGDGVGCVSCHHGANTMGARDLTAREVAELDPARNAQVDRLARAIWTRLTE